MKTNKELFNEINSHLMTDEKPSIFLNSLLSSEAFNKEYPFTMLSGLQNIEQSPKYHPEGNVWIHTTMVVDNAAIRKSQSTDPSAFMWAALLHDTGKADTTRVRRCKITSYNHEKLGEKLTADFLKEFIDDADFISKVAALVRWHMQLLHIVKASPYAQLDKMKGQVNAKELALLGLCDRLGRGGKPSEAEELENVRIFLDRCGVKGVL